MTITNESATTAAAYAETAAVAAVPNKIVAAWTKHDAAAFADTFTPDGTMVLPGLYLKGREAIKNYMAAAFNGPYKGTQVTGAPIDLRFINPDTAVAITAGGVLGNGQTELADSEWVRAIWVIARQDGKWQLAAYQNSPRDAA
jgi:uncharacterized protein (TIGR02246 family)